LKGWTDIFRSAEDLLVADSPRNPLYPDLLPQSGYTTAGRQVLAASVRSFVFGGNGSWNDVYLPDKRIKEEFEELTDELYEAVVSGMVSAVNCGMEG